MKSHIHQLHTIAQQQERRILGLMSGTSLDGLDLALCRFSGNGFSTKVVVEQFVTLPYSTDFKAKIKEIFAKQVIDFQELVLLNVEVADCHAALVLEALAAWKIESNEVDLIASHGQTVFHAPKRLHGQNERPNATLQIGDGDHLAVKTGIITVSDFRQKHTAMGGQGAPLALYGDAFLFSKQGQDLYLLNLGGIANFTYLPADGDFSKAFATDTGPSNTFMDYWAQKEFGQAYDKDAIIAKAGRVEPRLLQALLTHPFFEEKLPKSTGQETFSPDFLENVLQLLPKGRANPFDVMTTLVELTARSVADALNAHAQSNATNTELYLSGGGAQNPLLVERITALLPDFQVFSMESLGISADAKEAVLFAALANETVCGMYEKDAILGNLPLFGMGKISFPL